MPEHQRYGADVMDVVLRQSSQTSSRLRSTRFKFGGLSMTLSSLNAPKPTKASLVSCRKAEPQVHYVPSVWTSRLVKLSIPRLCELPELRLMLLAFGLQLLRTMKSLLCGRVDACSSCPRLYMCISTHRHMHIYIYIHTYVRTYIHIIHT